MASLASTAVTIRRSWVEGSINGKRHKVLLCDVVLTGQGGSTNKILATAFGLTVIESVTAAVKSDDAVIYPAVASTDGSYVLLANLADATDATRVAGADITATVSLTVKGY